MSSPLRTLLEPVMPNLPQIQGDQDSEIVREIPVETLFLALKEADTETVLWFFQNALPEQVQALIDIDCWDGSTFLPERYEAYFKTISLLGPQKIGDYMRHLDPEIIVRGLLEYCSVQDYDPTEPPDLPENSFLITLDSKYILMLKTQNPEIRELLYLWLNKFSAIDLELLRRHCESCKWESPSDLEEYAYTVKKGRLEDIGFVDYHDAISLYSRGTAPELKRQLLENPLPAGSKAPSPFGASSDENWSTMNESLLPEPLTEPLFNRGFLRDALKQISSPSLKSIVMMELIRAVNSSLAADKALHGDLEKIRVSTIRARNYIELGLIYLSDGQLSRAALMLESHPLEQVFRLGWLAIQDLVTVAKQIEIQFKSNFLAPIDEELLQNLKGRHPQLSEAVLRDLEPGSTLTQVDPFRLFTLDGLVKVGRRLTELHCLAKFFATELATALKITESPLREGESSYTRLLTGLFRESSGATFSADPIHTEEWKRLSQNFNRETMEKLSLAVTERVPELARDLFSRRIRSSTDDLNFYLQSHRSKMPDPRFFRVLNLGES